ncbi:MAG: deoxyhypusine synthase family protein [Planctomycetes bacterium]|nr:deoxyhypusine synthase family protein [Planctomycetota bacterium]
MTHRTLHDGRVDGLVPLESLNLADVHSFADLLRGMRRTAFGGRQLGEAFDILLETARRPDVRVVLTVSGAMTVAKQGRLICDMIDRGLVHAVVATGALIAHGLTESIGLLHYRYDPSHSDEALFERGYNRIYDTLEMEANLNDLAEFVSEVIEKDPPADGVWSSARVCRAVGRALQKASHGPGVLRSAFEQDVPVFIPAFTDSEMGLDFVLTAVRKALSGAAQRTGGTGGSPTSAEGRDDYEAIYQSVPPFNPFLDLQEYARLILSGGTWGILTIGGGVPRNWAQQVGPYVDITNGRLGTKLPVPRFRYGVRICPEPVHWGGLSGCTYSEGVSWGKFVPPDEGGRYAEVASDATLVWPLLMKAVFEELDGAGP